MRCPFEVFNIDLVLLSVNPFIGFNGNIIDDGSVISTPVLELPRILFCEPALIQSSWYLQQSTASSIIAK